MTHPIYSKEQLQDKTLADLKAIALQLNATAEDKRSKDSWINAIVEVQPQLIAQAELEAHIEQQAEEIAPEIRTVEISFYDHEVYAGETQIAAITYDTEDFVTQPWIVMVSGVEIHRANAFAKAEEYVRWHHKQGTLPVFKTLAPIATGNEILVQIASECDRFGVELQDDGIYQGNLKLGEVGCSDGRWWVIRAASQHQQPIPCDDAFDAVWSLFINAGWVLLKRQPANTRVERAKTVEVLEQHGDKFIVRNCDNDNYYVVRPNHQNRQERCECGDCYYRGVKCKHQLAVERFFQGSELLDKPFDELTSQQWGWLKEREFQEETELVAA